MVLTVPASFDAAARELTVEAALAAGLEHLTLLEEPQAALYAWIEATGDAWRKQITRRRRHPRRRRRRRHHRLLGHRRASSRTASSSSSASPSATTSCSAATTWTSRSPTSCEPKLRGRGQGARSLADERAHPRVPRREGAAARRRERSTSVPVVDRRAAARSSLGGAHPHRAHARRGRRARSSTASSPGGRRRRGPRSRARAALTSSACPTRQIRPSPGTWPRSSAARRTRSRLEGFAPAQGSALGTLLHPTAVLFNGGVMKAALLRERVVATLNAWLASDGRAAAARARGAPISISRWRAAPLLRPRATRARPPHPRRHGARLLRRHRERRARGARASSRRSRALCVAPFGMEEGTEADAAAARARRGGRRAGALPLLRLVGAPRRRGRHRCSSAGSDGELEELAPIEVTLPADGRARGRVVPVRLHAAVTEVGHAAARGGADASRTKPDERWQRRAQRALAERLSRRRERAWRAMRSSSGSISGPRTPSSPGPIRSTRRRRPAIFADPAARGASEIARAPAPAVVPLRAASPSERVADPWGEAPWTVGELARRRGARSAAGSSPRPRAGSAHAAVDRTAPILPWGSRDDGRPATHLAGRGQRAATSRTSRGPGTRPSPSIRSRQDVVLTVPASFDEVARELTLEAARRAGLARAAPRGAAGRVLRFHAPRRRRAASQRRCSASARFAAILVCDVGGGTTDLSLMRVGARRDGEASRCERVAVGNHLLLGGDNMDLALAHAVERELVARAGSARRRDASRARGCVPRGQGATARGRSRRKRCRSRWRGPARDWSGSARTCRSRAATCRSIVLEGFFPRVAAGEPVARARGGLLAFGLPYERDVAITRHLVSFLARHAALGPSAVLFNGGVFHARAIAERATEVLSSLRGADVAVLQSSDPDLAVARGAVVYGLSRRGLAAADRVRGRARVLRGARARQRRRGPPRGVRHSSRREGRGDARGPRASAFARGRAAGPVRPLQLRRRAGARAWHSGRRGRGALRGLASARGDLRQGGRSGRGRRGARRARRGAHPGRYPRARLRRARACPAQPRRFRLAFQLRPSAEASEPRPSTWPRRGTSEPAEPGGGASSRRSTPSIASTARVAPTWPAATPRICCASSRRSSGERSSWTLALARALHDALWDGHKARRRSADHERLFWLLAGYTIRPGFGDVRDPARIARLAPLFGERVAFIDNPRVWQQFWIAWRRAAGGLPEAWQTHGARRARSARRPLGQAPEENQGLEERGAG